jgi:DNA replication licensing factor MCM2
LWIGLEPSLILPELNNIAYSIACKNFASYKEMFPEVYVRITDLPIMDHIRDLRYTHLGKFIKIRGVITIRSEVFSQLKKIFYKCYRCGLIKGPFYINSVNNVNLGNCASCQSTGPFPIEKTKTVYRNYQKITVQ